MTEELSRLSDDIMEVWGDYDDFDSADYITWVIEQNIEDIRNPEETRNWGDYESELADIAICAIRALAELPKDEPAEYIIRRRLRDRMEGNQEEIIAKYKSLYARLYEDEEL